METTQDDKKLANVNKSGVPPSGPLPPAMDIWRQHATNGQHRVVPTQLTSRGARDLVTWDKVSTDAGRGSMGWGLAEDRDPLLDARILIIDDCTLYRENLANNIVANGIAAPGVAWDLPSLVNQLDGTTPNIVLLSIGTRDNLKLLQAALQISPAARVIVLGVSEDNESEIIACAEAGVAGYHTRTESLDHLLGLIRRIAAGESACSPRVAAILLNRLSALAAERQPPPPKELVLTAREAQILRMLEVGLSNRDIASRLCIAVHTVKNHVHSLLKKLGVSTRAEAAALSRTIRYTDDDDGN